MILIATLGVGIAIYLSGCTHRDKPTTPNQPIPNQPPTAKITLPNDGDSFAEGYAIVFMGSAVDSEDGVLTDSSLVWASSLDGQIGMGTDFSNSYLSVGSHSIVLTATDSGNKQASDSITVIVNQTPPGAVVYSFSSPGNCPIGLGWDGSYLWNSDDCAGKIYKIDPSKGWIIDLFSSPDSEPSGLTWDGSYLWCTGMSKDKIYKLDPSDGSIVDSFSSPGGSPIGTLMWKKLKSINWILQTVLLKSHFHPPEIIPLDLPGMVIIYGVLMSGSVRYIK